MTTNPNTDDAKGRIKEAAGALTRNDDLKREGKQDQMAGKAKEAVNDAADKVADGIDKLRNRND